MYVPKPKERPYIAVYRVFEYLPYHASISRMLFTNYLLVKRRNILSALIFLFFLIF